MDRNTHYINTDLDLQSTADLAPVVEFFESKGLHALHSTRFPRKGYVAALETNRQFEMPQATIKAMLRAIEAMPQTSTEIWNACKRRSLNIGYQCGHEPQSIEHGLDNDVISRIARSGLALKITLYRCEQN